MMQQPAPGASMVPPPPQQYAQQPPPQQQQWLPHQMQAQPPTYQMPPPQQPPQYYYQQPPAAVPPPAQAQPVVEDGIRSLWIGDLQYWMDEQYLYSCFAATGEVVSAKVIRNKQTAQSEGYGFIEFVSHAAAEKNLHAYNGIMMPSVEQTFRLNWASMGAGEKRDDAPEYTIFVGDLSADVTDYVLQETFRVNYTSVKGAKVVTDRITGRSKGYGFVRFGDESEQIRAMTEMNGAPCSTRPMRIGLAANKQKMGGQSNATYQTSQVPSDDDPTNTTVFVGNVDSNVTDDHIRQLFGHYGQLLHVKILVSKRCAFVQYADRSCAEEAIRGLNGTQLGGQSIRLSWGKNPSNKQQADQSQYNAGYYGYTPGYETYGYAPPAQDPNMYYGGYAGYGNYPPQAQQPQQ